MKRRAGAPLHHDPEAIINAREQADLTQTKVAEKLKVSLPLVCMIEAGTRNAGPARLRELARIFGVPVTTLERKRDIRQKPAADKDDEPEADAA